MKSFAPAQWSEDEVAVLVASGPSITQEDVDYCREKARVLVVNDCYKLAPWADALYACDPAWWTLHEGAPAFKGQRWTQSKKAAELWNLSWITGDHRSGLSLEPELIHFGHNSGYQALNLAVLFGVKKIILLGYDMKRTNGKEHWFGDHPPKLKVAIPFPMFLKAFDSVGPDLERAGVNVINCTRETALTCFPKAELRETLREPVEAVA